MIISILQFIIGFLLIGLVVFFHELGHFISARMMNVDVDVFAFGMGPTLFSYYGKKTEYRIAAFPFGGYCRMKGSIELGKALSEKKRDFGLLEEGSYFSRSPFRRFVIYLSGPLSNFLLSVLLFSLVALIPVPHTSDDAYVTDTASYPEIYGEYAYENDIEKGDLILSIDGHKVNDYQSFVSLLPTDGESITLEVLRKGKVENISIDAITIEKRPYYGIALIKEPVIGESSSPSFSKGDRIISSNGQIVHNTLDVATSGNGSFDLEILRNGEIVTQRIEGNDFPFSWQTDYVKRRSVLTNPFSYGISMSIRYFLSTLEGLGALLSLDFPHLHQMMQGPVFASNEIGRITTLAAGYGVSSTLRTVLYLLSLVSISLFSLNILPIPAFDGGQMLLALIEMIKRHPLRPRTYVAIEITGLFFAVLIILGMYSIDLLRLII